MQRALEIAVYLLLVTLSLGARADGFVDVGGSLFVNGGVSSPGFVSLNGSTNFGGFSMTQAGQSAASGNFRIDGFASVPTLGSSASAFGSVMGGAFASHSQFGRSISSNSLSTSASATATGSGSSGISVNGSTSGSSFTFPTFIFVPLPMPPVPVPNGGKG